MAKIRERFVFDKAGRPAGVHLDFVECRSLLEELETEQCARAYDLAKASGDMAAPFEPAPSLAFRKEAYALTILPAAARQLASLPREALAETVDGIRGLAADPRPQESEKIAGRDGWRRRCGSYRVIYEIDTAAHEVTVLDVARRSDV